MKVTIDRFEGDFAVCEKANRKMLNIGRNLLPFGAKEGDTLIIANGKVSIDLKAAEARKKRIEKLYKNIWE